MPMQTRAQAHMQMQMQTQGGGGLGMTRAATITTARSASSHGHHTSHMSSSDAMDDREEQCQFVARDYGESDDEMDDAVVVTRSTPVEFVCGPAAMQMDDAMDGMGSCKPTREIPSRTQLVAGTRAVNFSSLAEVFPLNTTGTSTSSAIPTPPMSTKHQSMPMFPLQTTTNTAQEGFPPTFVASSHAQSTAAALAPADAALTNTTGLLLSDELTKPLERSRVSLKRDGGAEQDRHSPFGPVPTSSHDAPYSYAATKAEVDEMDRMRWTFQQQGLKRSMTLEQKEKEWGTLQVRDSRLAFQHGERYAATMAEKKFYNELCRRGHSEEYCKRRRLELERVIEEFTREETKHRQALSLAYLEKNSIFCRFPVLGNRFILIRLLGKGGNGEVWDVIDYADKQRRCALKLSVLHSHARREHFTHQRLHHHNIVGVGDAVFTIEYQQQLYTAFTVDGVEADLQQLIEIYDRYDEESSLKVLYQLLHALSYLHDQMKIAHYDIKPTNILIGNDECVKLTDFDLARDVNEPIRSCEVGTMRYLPPECFRANYGNDTGTAEKADIWMVGIVFCMLLGGKHPILPDKTSTEEAKAILARFNGRLQFSRPLSDVSRWIIQSCLNPDPRCRPSAAQLFQALQNASTQS